MLVQLVDAKSQSALSVPQLAPPESANTSTPCTGRYRCLQKSPTRLSWVAGLYLARMTSAGLVAMDCDLKLELSMRIGRLDYLTPHLAKP